MVGLGLNVNVDFRQVKLDPASQSGNGHTPLWEAATSLSMILGRDTDELRLPILQAFLVNVERRYQALRQGMPLYREWRSRLIGLGQTVIIKEINGQSYQGIMADVDENGALILQQANGLTKTFVAGEVTLRIKE